MSKSLILDFKSKVLFCLAIIFLYGSNAMAQISNQPGANGIQTYVNPILPGDHPDQTMMRVGKDFYTTGSSFHFTPYLPILHSTDMMHWETIARVIQPTSSIPNNDKPAAGTWEGALAQFNNKFWVYFSNNNGGGQYFCTATNMAGPWSLPVKVNTNTGVYGYDNSIFVDDDGTPYMLLKNGQDLNGLQKLGMDGQPTGQALNMNWINSNGHPYSWAEGPVMCKRNGRYYLFVAGDVSGGQYVLSSAKLSNVESDWTRHGTFWQAPNNPGGFTGPNHISQPIKLDDGTWWCLSHAYNNGGWEAQGRQSHLHQVIWDGNGVPKGIPVNSNPVLGPNLPSSGINYEFDKSDYFESTTLSLNWHFFNKTMASTSRYSLSDSPGMLRLKPGNTTTHILQKEKGQYYSLTTKVDLNATGNGQQAGIRIMNGNDDLFFTLYTSYNNGKKIGLAFSGSSTEVNNTIGNTVWLRVERAAHILTGFYSADGLAWIQIGTKDVSSMDKTQANYNEWVGTSIGLFASNINADFEQFSYRYGFVPIRVEGRNNWYGVTFANKTPGRVVTNSTSGDWLALAGVDLGSGARVTTGIEVNVASLNSTSSLEIWMNNIGGTGTKVATIAIPNTGGTDTWKNVTANFNASGQHDLYLRWVGGSNSFCVNTIRFLFGAAVPDPVVSITAPTNNTVYTEGDNVTINATATITTGSISKVDFYNGTTLLGTDASSPYSYTMNAAVAGNYTVTAKATSAANTTTTSSAISIQVAKPIFQAGSAPVIDGTVESLWNNYPSVAITHLLSGAVSSAADLSGNWKAAWDAKNLYVLVQVTDDIKRNDASTGVYNDDGVEIYVDLGNTKSTTYGANDAQYTFRWNDATAAYEINGHSVAGITRGISNTSTGYIVEVSIPWATIGGSASVNNFEGFEVMINDNDDGTRDAKMAWMATTDDTYANPSLMGTVVLKGLNCTAPTAAITAVGSTTFCAGGSVTLNASAGTGNSYVWKNGTTVIAGASTASYVAKTAGSYSVSITNSGGCSATSTGTTVTVNALPVVSLYSQVDGGTWDQITSTTVCASSTVVLGPQPNVNTGWSWSGPGNYRATTREITLTGLAANKSGNYTAMYTDGNGCKATGVYVLTVNATPVAPTVTGTTSYCQNGTASQLTATGTGLLWYTQATGGTGSAAAPTPTTTTTGTTNYYVSQTTTGCESSRAMIAVTVNALPTANITATTPTSFCTGGSVVLTASSGSSYKWMNGTTQVGTGASYTAITSGSYTVEVTNGGNCKATSSATNVTVNAAAVAPVVTSAQTYCQNGAASQLSATGTGLLWYTQATGGTGSAAAPTPTTTTTGATNYYVSQTTTGCESARAMITVTVTNKPTASITTTTPTSFCTGGSVTLTASSGSSYKWMNGTTQVGSGSSYTASTSGSYTVEVTNGGNCKATSTATNVSVNAVPVAPTVTGTTYCQNDPATVLSAIGTNVKWYTQATGGIGSTTAPTPATTTSGTVNYYVSQTTTGCESSRAMIEVIVNALPVASITAESSTNIPQGGNVVLIASTGSSYKWFKGATQVGTESSYTATVPGVYSVEIMNANNCSARSAGTNVNLNSNQPSVITITSPTTSTTVQGAITITATVTDPDGSIVLVEYLDGNTVIGTSTSAPYSFVWNTPTAGDHDITVRVTDSNGGITTSAPVTITSEVSSTTTGLYSSNSNSLTGTLYPNPANGIVFIDSDMDLSDASFMLVDVLGNEHSISQTATGMGASIDVSNLSAGTYVLIVKKDNSVMRKKITVMK